MDFVGWVFLIIAIVAIIQVVMVSNKKKAMEKVLEALPDFSPTQKIMGNNGDTGLAVDEERKKICLIKNEVGGINLETISYRDVLSSEIFVDGETVTRTARGSQIGGALLGGLALGGVGAIIGGLSGKTRSSEKVKRVDLRITINDTKRPLHDINFMDTEGKKDGIVYKVAMDQARHWHGLITVLIKYADSQDVSENKAALNEGVAISSKRSIADELSKLSDLRDKGLLTDAEFIALKQKLLT